MQTDPLKRLIELLSEFPGIGPRQAQRMVYFLVRKNNGFKDLLANNIQKLGQDVSICESCSRHFYSPNRLNICNICSDETRDKETLAIVAYDTDVDAIESSGVFRGQYLVLGNTIPLLEKNPEEKINLNKVIKKINSMPTLKEILFAFNATPDGDNTADFIDDWILPIKSEKGFSTSRLGRGLSTGSELEYSDKKTLRSALEHREKK